MTFTFILCKAVEIFRKAIYFWKEGVIVIDYIIANNHRTQTKEVYNNSNTSSLSTAHPMDHKTPLPHKKRHNQPLNPNEKTKERNLPFQFIWKFTYIECLSRGKGQLGNVCCFLKQKQVRRFPHINQQEKNPIHRLGGNGLIKVTPGESHSEPMTGWCPSHDACSPVQHHQAFNTVGASPF